MRELKDVNDHPLIHFAWTFPGARDQLDPDDADMDDDPDIAASSRGEHGLDEAGRKVVTRSKRGSGGFFELQYKGNQPVMTQHTQV